MLRRSTRRSSRVDQNFVRSGRAIRCRASPNPTDGPIRGGSLPNVRLDEARLSHGRRARPAMKEDT
jgi:hypothetical protein